MEKAKLHKIEIKKQVQVEEKGYSLGNYKSSPFWPDIQLVDLCYINLHDPPKVQNHHNYTLQFPHQKSPFPESFDPHPRIRQFPQLLSIVRSFFFDTQPFQKIYNDFEELISQYHTKPMYKILNTINVAFKDYLNSQFRKNIPGEIFDYQPQMSYSQNPFKRAKDDFNREVEYHKAIAIMFHQFMASFNEKNNQLSILMRIYWKVLEGFDCAMVRNKYTQQNLLVSQFVYFLKTRQALEESYTTMRGIILSNVKIPMTPQEEDILQIEQFTHCYNCYSTIRRRTPIEKPEPKPKTNRQVLKKQVTPQQTITSNTLEKNDEISNQNALDSDQSDEEDNIQRYEFGVPITLEEMFARRNEFGVGHEEDEEADFDSEDEERKERRKMKRRERNRERRRNKNKNKKEEEDNKVVKQDEKTRVDILKCIENIDNNPIKYQLKLSEEFLEMMRQAGLQTEKKTES